MESYHEDLDWDGHVAKIKNQTNRIREMIRRSYEDKNVKNIVQLYKSLVRPHLEYAVQAWKPDKQFEKVQRQATKMIKGLASLPYNQTKY